MLDLSILLRGMELEIENIGIEENEKNEQCVKAILESVKQTSACPECGTESRKVQSQYMRTIADLPIITIAVILILQVKRFFCVNKGCRRKIFAERLEVVKPYRRKTARMEEALNVIAHAEGGESGARTANSLGMKVSPDTMLRQIRRTASPEVSTPKVLGVDEFSFKRGRIFGTILIDLENHKRVDVLRERSAESFAKWLKEHPEVEIISRDRGQIYADGGRQGAPNAIQVADRFHLVENVREAIERSLSSNYQGLKTTVATIAAETQQNKLKVPEMEIDNGVTQLQLSKSVTEENNIDIEQIDKTTSVEVTEQTSQSYRERQTQLSQESRERRIERYEQIKELSKQGMSGREIARHLSISRRTVMNFLHVDIFPERAQHTPPSMLDKFAPYLIQRLQSGIINSRKLWDEIKELGFTGSASLVRRFSANWKILLPLNLESKVAKSATKVPSTKQVSFWLLGLSKEKEEEKKIEHQNFVEKLCNISNEISKARLLGIEFIEMIRKRQGQLLDSWLEKAKISGIPSLKNFASGIELDKDAVFNAMTLPWSNGQVEGNNNRLKMLKRQMYGRAKFDLLRARVLSPT
jgi:transposase